MKTNEDESDFRICDVIDRVEKWTKAFLTKRCKKN